MRKKYMYIFYASALNRKKYVLYLNEISNVIIRIYLRMCTYNTTRKTSKYTRFFWKYAFYNITTIVIYISRD